MKKQLLCISLFLLGMLGFAGFANAATYTCDKNLITHDYNDGFEFDLEASFNSQEDYTWYNGWGTVLTGKKTDTIKLTINESGVFTVTDGNTTNWCVLIRKEHYDKLLPGAEATLIQRVTEKINELKSITFPVSQLNVNIVPELILNKNTPNAINYSQDWVWGAMYNQPWSDDKWTFEECDTGKCLVGIREDVSANDLFTDIPTNNSVFPTVSGMQDRILIKVYEYKGRITVKFAPENLELQAYADAAIARTKDNYYFLANDYILKNNFCTDNFVEDMKLYNNIAKKGTSLLKDINDSSLSTHVDVRLGDCSPGNLTFGGILQLLKNDIIYAAAEPVIFYGAIEIPNLNTADASKTRTQIKTYLELILKDKEVVVSENSKNIEVGLGGEVAVVENIWTITIRDKAAPIGFISRALGMTNVYAADEVTYEVTAVNGNSLLMNQNLNNINPAKTLDNVGIYVLGAVISFGLGIILIKKLKETKA